MSKLEPTNEASAIAEQGGGTTKVEQLIQQYCPDGVEYKSIESVTKSICSGLNPRKNFTLNGKGAICYYLTVKEMTTGKIVFSDKTDKITPDAVNTIQNRSRLETDDILLSGIGTIGKVAIVDIPVDNWNCSESVLLLKPKKEIIYPKYLKYILEGNETQAYFNFHATGSTLKGIRQKDLRTHFIPVPPLPVQEEIVRILDTLTELQAELQAELQKRKQQYEYYRDKLLSFSDLGNWGRNVSVEWKKLGDVADLLSGFPFDSTQFTKEGVRLMRGVNIKRGQLCFNENDDRYWKSTAGLEKYIVDENDIVISMDGSLVGKSFGMVKKEHLPLLLVQRVARIRSSVFNINFIYHCINNWFPNYVDKKKTQGAIPHISMNDIANFPIPSPSLEEQEKIASILDRFDTLTTDITAGLPAEIEARRKQYEYYRDKLLTFKKK